MKHNFHSLRLGLLLALAFVPSCTPAKPVAEADYGVKIVGNWLDELSMRNDRGETSTFTQAISV
jgi:hypothetical protein